jgi:hypothetical protein
MNGGKSFALTFKICLKNSFAQAKHHEIGRLTHTMLQPWSWTHGGASNRRSPTMPSRGRWWETEFGSLDIAPMELRQARFTAYGRPGPPWIMVFVFSWIFYVSSKCYKHMCYYISQAHERDCARIHGICYNICSYDPTCNNLTWQIVMQIRWLWTWLSSTLILS